MPIYEFICKSCGFKFDKLFLSVAAYENSKDLTCPQCGSNAIEKAFSVFSTNSHSFESYSSCSSGSCDYSSPSSSSCCCGNGSCSID